MPAAPHLLLLTDADLHVESLMNDTTQTVAGVSFAAARSPNGAGAAAQDFSDGCVADALRRSDKPSTRLEATPDWMERLADLADEAGVATVTTGFVPVGWVRDVMQGLEACLSERGIALNRLQRDWDAVIWPHCGKGYFKLKKQLPDLLAQLGLPV